IMRSNNTSKFPTIDESFGSHRRVKRLFTEGITDETLSLYTSYFFDTEVGEKYTMSIKVKPEETVNLKLWNGLEKKCIKGKWTTLSNTITSKDNRERFMGLFSDNDFSPDFTHWIEYKDLKEEKGNKATAWTPAPEDTDAKISHIETEWTQTFDSFSQTVAGIDGRVTSQKQTIDSITQTVTDHTGKIATVEQNVHGIQQT